MPEALGRYVLEATLGRGGMGTVYRARDRGTGQEVALKTLELREPHAQELFEREYQTLASLSHPSVVETFDYGLTPDGRRYYTMQLIEGQDLYALAPMAWQPLCAHLRDVAEALSLLHGRGLVHRDVSPRNIRIDAQGQARLLDFGALVPFGIPKNVVGTPICIAPEAIRKQSLDGRSDLFSLGATAYVALTRHRPYAIRSLQDALEAYRTPPLPLLQHLPDLPVELADLILMLLQIDPTRRPASAADVIERLNMIAGATESDESPVPMGQFTSPALAGREREMEQLRNHLGTAVAGRGSALVIEGAPRIGKSRMAQELAVGARMMGAAVVRAEAQGKGAAGTAYQDLVWALLQTLPAEAHACLAAEPLLAAFVERGIGAVSKAGTGVPAQHLSHEASGALQTAVVRWIEAIAERTFLVVIVEDAHALDAASAGVVFGLAHGLGRRRILLALTISSDVQLSGTVARLVRLCSRIKLRALSSESLDSLVGSVFGQVAHSARLSRWLEAVSGGNPGHTLDLMTALVRRRVIKWLGGAWSLPRQLPQDALPASVQEALMVVLGDLDADALELARCIAMQTGSVPLATCCELMKPCTHDHVLGLCDTLLAHRIVALGSTGYRIAHEGFRDALLSALDVAARSQLHRAIGEALLAHARYADDRPNAAPEALPAETVSTCLQAGWHLLHGGEERRGRQLLRTMGIRLTRRGVGLADAVPALESALAAYEAHGRDRYEKANLMVPLTLAGTYLDLRLTYRYGVAAIETMAEACGIDLARRLARVLPRRAALYAALGFAAVRVRLTQRRVLAGDFEELVLGLIGLATATLGTYCSLTDAVAAKRLLSRLEPLAWFPRGHAAAAAHSLQIALADVAYGRYADALAGAREVLASLERPDGVRHMPLDAKRQFVVGVHIVIGTIDCYRADGRVFESIEALERAATPTALETAAGLRANHHANRGEMKAHYSAREALDVLAAQGGSPWRQDVLMPRCLWWIEAQCEDAMSLKRSIRQLEANSRDCAALASTVAAAHACYLADRGLAAEALSRYGPTLEAAARAPTVLATRFAGAYARVLRLAGQPALARDICSETLERLTAPERELVCLFHGVEVELGRALASLGDLDNAAAHLDQLCEADSTHDNPLLHALAHLARAEVAVAQADGSAFSEHLAEAERWAVTTQYAPLFGLVQRLQARARVAGLDSDLAGLAPPDEATVRGRQVIRETIALCRGVAERQQVALDLLIEHARAASGYLYLAEPHGLRLAAPLHGAEPPDGLCTELEARVHAWRSLDECETVFEPVDALQTVVHDGARLDPVGGLDAKLGSAHRIVFLLLPRSRTVELVGVAALVEGTQPMAAIDGTIIEAVARGVYEAGDATFML